MKKFLKVILVIFALSATSAYAKSSKADETSSKTEVSSDRDDSDGGSRFELLFGPRFDVKNYGVNFFTAGMAVGGKYIKFGVNYSHASPAGVSFNAFKPYLMIDIPFGFDIGSNGLLVIAPTIDFGPEFGFIAGQKTVDVLVLGYGLKTQYYFTHTFGVGLTPFHLSNSFATWTSGGTGLTRQTRISYDLFFSLLLKW
ncbi:MAG: hypothetical protein WCQ53_03605 [bacterium]